MKTIDIIDALNQLSMNFESERVQYDSCREPDYVPDFIMQTNWGCSRAHIYDKFRYYHKQDGRGWVMPFYNELDDVNGPAFCEWLEKFAYVRMFMRLMLKDGNVMVPYELRDMFLRRCERHGIVAHGGIMRDDDQCFYVEK